MGSVGDDIDDEKSHLLGLNNEIAQASFAIMPEQSLTTAEEEDAHAKTIELLHLMAYLLVWMDDALVVVNRAVLARQVTLVGEDDGAQDGLFTLEDDTAEPKACKVDE